MQPEISIGLIGHVDHGKTTLLQALSGKWADTHSEEVKRGITIKLGYADVSFYSCEKHGYSAGRQCNDCKKLRTVSFVDAPGHETLMATMISGTAIMDGALLLVAADEECPQPQTREHLMALEIVGIKNIVIAQNKIDVVPREQALKNYAQIREFIKGTIAEHAPIIPVSAKYRKNMNFLIEAIENAIKTPKRKESSEPLFFVARSFDINRPGTKIDNLLGGVLGGSVKQGRFKIGDEIEIRPGYHTKEIWKPLTTKIVGLNASSQKVDEILPGGSVAILTELDPSIVKSDQLSGAVVGYRGKLPQVKNSLTLQPSLLKRVLGEKEEKKVEPIKKGEPLMLIANASATAGIVASIEKKKFTISLKRPICAESGSKITISRRVGTRWRLVGWASL